MLKQRSALASQTLYTSEETDLPGGVSYLALGSQRELRDGSSGASRARLESGLFGRINPVETSIVPPYPSINLPHTQTAKDLRGRPITKLRYDTGWVALGSHQQTEKSERVDLDPPKRNIVRDCRVRLSRSSMETTSQTSQTTKFQIVAWIYKYSAFVVGGAGRGLFPFGQELQKVVTDKSVMTRWDSTVSKSNVIRVS